MTEAVRKWVPLDEIPNEWVMLASGDLCPIRVHFDIIDYGQRRRLWVGNQFLDSKILFAQRHEEDLVCRGATLEMYAHSTDPFQGLMDDLWRAGIRPSKGVASAGQIEAMKEHLEDLRKLVFAGRKE